MEEEAVYEFEILLDPHSSTTTSVEVRVTAPTDAGQGRHPLTSTVMEALKKRLGGGGLVAFVSPCGQQLTGGEEGLADLPCPAGRFFAVVCAEGCALPPLWEALMAGAHRMAARGLPDASERAYQAVLSLRREDSDFIYSLYRHLRETVPSMHVQHEAFAICRRYDAINRAVGQRRVQRQARLSAWSAAAPPAARHEEAGDARSISLLQLLHTLPPPFTPVDVLPLGSLVRLAQTCRAWYAYVVGSLLPPVLRRSKLNFEVGSWSFHEDMQERWWYCTLSVATSDAITTTTTTPPEMPWKIDAVPAAIRCPMLLRWMLTHEDRTGSDLARTMLVPDDRTRTDAVAALLQRLHNLHRQPCPQEEIKSCAGLLGLLAHGVVTFEKSESSSEHHAAHHMICLQGVVTGAEVPVDDDKGDEEEGIEVLCDVTYGSKTYS